MEVRKAASALATASSLTARCPSGHAIRSTGPFASTGSRCLNTTARSAATPLPHPTVPGPPPSPPQQSVSQPQTRLDRRRQNLELLRQAQQAKTNPAKPGSALQKRFWKNVSVHETPQGLQIHLDGRPVRAASCRVLTLPHSKRALAAAIALEWDHLVSAQQALKQHYVPLTSLTSRALDIQEADAESKPEVREALSNVLMRYLGTDTLLCWAPEKNMHEPDQERQSGLRRRQIAVAEPVIAFLKTHLFPGVDIHPILGEHSIMPTPQPEVTREVIRGWMHALPAFELAALERAVLATKSLLVGARVVVEWSREFAHLRKDAVDGAVEDRFGVEKAAEAASLEVLHQTEQWGEVEDTHDVERADMRRQLGSVVLLVS